MIFVVQGTSISGRHNSTILLCPWPSGEQVSRGFNYSDINVHLKDGSEFRGQHDITLCLQFTGEESFLTVHLLCHV
jgi:hypothetical protein